VGIHRAAQDDRGGVGKKRQERLDQEIGALDVDVDGPIERCLIPIADRPEIDNAGVGKNRVEPSEGGL